MNFYDISKLDLDIYKNLVKSKIVPRKASVQNRVSAILSAFRRHEDEKENMLLFYLEIISKKLEDSY